MARLTSFVNLLDVGGRVYHHIFVTSHSPRAFSIYLSIVERLPVGSIDGRHTLGNQLRER